MNIDDEAGLRLALRTLPLDEPPDQLWSQLQLRLTSTSRPRRWPVIWAMAAGIALTAIGMTLWRGNPTTGESPLLALQQQSELLEQRLSEQRRNGNRYSIRTAELEQSLADGLALTDLKLSAARDEAETTELWQRRVALLSTWIDLGAMGAEVTDTAPTSTDEEPWL